MNRFFNMDNKFFVFMGRVADLLLLNFLCILCCIPVVTAGASITALSYVTLKMARDEESYIARSFSAHSNRTSNRRPSSISSCSSPLLFCLSIFGSPEPEAELCTKDFSVCSLHLH